MLGDKRKSSGKYWLILALLFVGVITLLYLLIRTHNVAILAPQGLIARKERNLLLFGAILSLLVVIPVYIMTFTIAWKYRASNKQASYTPDWDHDVKIETVWWLIPLALITVLSVVTWNSSHDLDPFKPLNSSTKPITIQVVALQWRWLFIYPQQGIASLNYVQFPEKTPVNFEITADAPMNSFWIPELGGQMYAMSGMSTKLHLIADQVGEFKGSSANISGSGFAGMKFIAQSRKANDFAKWVDTIRSSGSGLDMDSYLEVAKPSNDTTITSFNLFDHGLYSKIVMKFMEPTSGQTQQTHMYRGVE